MTSIYRRNSNLKKNIQRVKVLEHKIVQKVFTKCQKLCVRSKKLECQKN